MIPIYATVPIAAVTAFLIGAAWYSPLLFGDAAIALRPAAQAGTVAPSLPVIMSFEVLRCLILSTAFAVAYWRLGITGLPGALVLAVAVWGGFQVFAMIGSILHESYPARLFAIHMGDALVKALAICVILALLSEPLVATEEAP